MQGLPGAEEKLSSVSFSTMKNNKFRFKYFPTGSMRGYLQILREVAVSIFHKDTLSRNTDLFSTLHLIKANGEGLICRT